MEARVGGVSRGNFPGLHHGTSLETRSLSEASKRGQRPLHRLWPVPTGWNAWRPQATGKAKTNDKTGVSFYCT